MFEQQVSYYLLNPFRSQGWPSKCTVHLITRQEKEIMEECSNFPQHLKKISVRGGVSSKFLCSRWVRTQGDNARKQESLAFLRTQELCTTRYVLYFSGGLWNGNFTLRWTLLSCGSMHILEIWHLPSLFGTLPASILVFMENKFYCQG